MTVKPDMISGVFLGTTIFIVINHVEPRVNHYVPNEGSFPRKLNYSDLARRTNATLDVSLESRIDDYWSMDGGWEPSGPRTGFTQFTRSSEKPPNGYTWSGSRLTQIQATSRPDYPALPAELTPLINQPINQSIHQLINQRINQLIN